MTRHKIAGTYFLFIMIFYNVSFAQQQDLSKENRSKAIIGTSVTYIWDSQKDPVYGITDSYEAWTWSINVALPIKRFRIGVNSYWIYTQSERSGKDYYLLAGVFAQYNLTPKRRVRAYPELNFHRGNYCPCGTANAPLDPYKINGLYYLGVGGGGDIKLSQRWHLDIAFLVHHLLNKVKGEYLGYNLYIIGAEYHLQ